MRLDTWEPDRRFDVDDFAQRLGVSLAEEDLVNVSVRNTNAPPGSGVTSTIRICGCEALQELGLAKDINGAGMLDITCPFVDEHTNAADSGSAYLGNERFKCHHRCECRDSLDFHAKIKEMLASQIEGDAFADAASGEGWLATSASRCVRTRTRRSSRRSLRSRQGAGAEGAATQGYVPGSLRLCARAVVVRGSVHG